MRSVVERSDKGLALDRGDRHPDVLDPFKRELDHEVRIALGLLAIEVDPFGQGRLSFGYRLVHRLVRILHGDSRVRRSFGRSGWRVAILVFLSRSGRCD